MAGLWGLFGRKAEPDANPLPGIGGDDSARGRAGEDGFPGSTAQTRTFPGRNPNQPRSTQGPGGDWTTIKADTNYGITPVTEARAQMQADPREFYGGQPLRTRPGFNLAGQNPLSGAAAAGGHSQRDTTTPWIDAQPVISGTVPGSANVAVDLDDQQPVNQQVYLGVGDRPLAEQRAFGQVMLVVSTRYQDRVG